MQSVESQQKTRKVNIHYICLCDIYIIYVVVDYLGIFSKTFQATMCNNYELKI